MNVRQAIKIAKDTSNDAGYVNATVTDAGYNEDEDTFEVELESGDVIINVIIDANSGEVVGFTTD